MPIQVDTPTASGPPAVKFGDVGSYVNIGIVNVEEVQSRDYDTGDAEVWPDGKPKMHPRITGIVVAAKDVQVGPRGEERPVEVGELVSIYAQGGRIYTYREAKKAHGNVEVGDVMQWKFDREEPARNPRHAPRKVFEAKLRHPNGEDGDLAKRCEKAYYELASRPTVDAAAPAARAEVDEAPF